MGTRVGQYKNVDEWCCAQFGWPERGDITSQVYFLMKKQYKYQFFDKSQTQAILIKQELAESELSKCRFYRQHNGAKYLPLPFIMP